MNMRKDRICIGALCLLLAGCGGHQLMSAPNNGGSSATQNGVSPHVLQTGHVPVQWTQFSWGGTPGLPHQFDTVVSGTDKNVWYTDYNNQALIKITMTGSTHSYPLVYSGSTHYFPSGMAVGSDGKFYMTSGQSSGQIGVATTSGAFVVHAIPSGDYSYGGSATKGPDGNVWFTELAHVGKITTGGVVTEYPYSDGNTANYYGGIAAGSDGDIWVTEYNGNIIDDVDTSTGSMTSYPLPCSPNGLVTASDGNLYAACSGLILRITTGGSVTSISNPYSTDGYSSAFKLGPDGNPWFTVSGRNEIGEYKPANNSLVIYFPPSTTGFSYGLAAASDGNVWAIDATGKTNVYIVNVLGVSPAALNMHVPNTATLTVTEPGTSSWTATSQSPGVASVVQGSPANKFTVTANGLGTTKITVKDAIGNSFVVTVHVT
jgi:streptogramin lyase